MFTIGILVVNKALFFRIKVILTRANWNVFRYQIRFFFRKLRFKHQKELLWMLLSERFERYYYISLYVLLYYYPFFKRRQMSHVQFICWEYVLNDCIIIWHYKNKLVINFIQQCKQYKHHFRFRNQPNSTTKFNQIEQ